MPMNETYLSTNIHPALIKKQKYSDLPDVQLKPEWTHPFSSEVKFKNDTIDDYKTLTSTSQAFSVSQHHSRCVTYILCHL